MAVLSKSQGIELAKLRYKELLGQYMTVFQEAQRDFDGELLVPTTELLREIKKIPSVSSLSSEEFALFKGLFSTKLGYIRDLDYLEAIKNWAGFLVAAFSDTKTLNKSEMRVLMSFKRGKEVPID